LRLLTQATQSKAPRIGCSDWVRTLVYLPLWRECRNSADYGVSVGQITEPRLVSKRSCRERPKPQAVFWSDETSNYRVTHEPSRDRGLAKRSLRVTIARLGSGSTLERGAIGSSWGLGRAAARRRERQRRIENPTQQQRKIAIQKCESRFCAFGRKL